MSAPEIRTVQDANSGAPQVGIIILNFNGSSVIPGLLDSIDKLDYPSFRVFFVDNASTDNSFDLARNRESRASIEIIINEKNLFFSAGNNVGIKRALEWGAEFVLLLNNDTIVPPALLTQLVDFLSSHEDVGVAGPLIHFADPPGHIWAAGGMVSTWFGLVRHRGIRTPDTGRFSTPSKVDYVSGAAMMVRRDVFKKIGFLDESFPMYYEDTDFSFRARKAGFDCWYVPTDPVIHLVSFAAGGQVSRFKVGRRFRSGMRFFQRHAKWYQWPTIIVGQIYEAVRVGLMVIGGKIRRG
jgi:hypothetical protein